MPAQFAEAGGAEQTGVELLQFERVEHRVRPLRAARERVECRALRERGKLGQRADERLADSGVAGRGERGNDIEEQRVAELFL